MKKITSSFLLFNIETYEDRELKREKREKEKEKERERERREEKRREKERHLKNWRNLRN